MRWFNNLRISAKLLTGFSVVALIAVIVGGVGITKIKTIDDADTRLYENMTVPIGDVGQLRLSSQRVSTSLLSLTIASTPADAQRIEARIAGDSKQIDSLMTVYKLTLIDDEDRQAHGKVQAALTAFVPLRERAIALTRSHRNGEAQALLRGEASDESAAIEASLDELAQLNIRKAKETADSNTVIANQIGRAHV